MGFESRDYYKPTGFGGFSFLPQVIKSILIINVIIFFIQVLFDNLAFGSVSGREILSTYFALNPIFHPAANFQIWQLISYQFMHGDFWHLFWNMFILWMFGMEIANLWGSKKFLVFYLACGVIAGLFQIVIGPIIGGGLGYTIGASGAVYGVMLAFAMYFPDRQIYLYFLIPVRAKYFIGFLVIIQILSLGDASVIAYLAHIGGAIAGVLFVLLDRRYHFDVDGWFRKIKSYSSQQSSKPKGDSFSFRRPSNFTSKKGDSVQDATFYDISENSKSSSTKEINQEEIDKILDKISQSGYQNLTDEEKRVLFEASKKG